MNKSDQAIAALRQAIELFSDYYLALERLGIEHIKRDQQLVDRAI